MTFSLLGEAAELPLQGPQITQQDVALVSDASFEVDVRCAGTWAAALALQAEVLTQRKLTVSFERFEVLGFRCCGYRCHACGLLLDIHAAARTFLEWRTVLNRALKRALERPVLRRSVLPRCS